MTEQPPTTNEEHGFNFTGIPTETSAQAKLPPLGQQSKSVGNGIYRRATNTSKLLLKKYENISTLYDSFHNASVRFSGRPCLGMRTIDPVTKKPGAFKFQTYGDIAKRVTNIGSGMRGLDIVPGNHIGIFSKNRVEWQLVSEASHAQSVVTIALYDTLGTESSLYIMNHGEIVSIFCSGEVIQQVFEIAPKCEYLKHIICFDPISDDLRQKAADLKLIIHTIQEVEKMGEEKPFDHVPPHPEDLATIMYTSGTTGTPKGVMLTHYNCIAAVTGVSGALFVINDQDVLISYLPLAHILERVAEWLFLQCGASIGFWMGDIRTVSEDIAELKPTFLPAVPRVLDRFYDKVKAGVETGGWLKQTLFQRAYAAKKVAQEAGKTTTVWDNLVFNKLKARIGGRVRGMLSGGAPLRPEVHEFLRVAFDAPIIQGYGLTETCAASSIQLPYDFTTSHIGPPLACCEIKLESVPDMQYFADADPPTGEILIRGPNVSIGYYKQPDITAEAFDSEGWFHTGDVGRWNANGTFTIIDRKKNMFKLSQGEYVAAESVEQRLGKCTLLSRIWIYGDSFKSCLVAVGVVNTPILVREAIQNGFPDATESNIEALIKEKGIKELILQRLAVVGKEEKLQGFEMVKAIHLVHQDFDTIDCVTPTMKLQRAALKKHFDNEINEMYAGLPQA